MADNEPFMSSTALVVIDIQNDYFPGGKMELEGADAAGAQAAKALAWARKGGVPIFHIRHLSVRPGATFFVPGTAGADIHESVRPAAGETVVEKNFPNSFRATNLKELIEHKQIKNLVVAGMMTHMCVDATVRHAADLGYKVTLLADACATRAQTFRGETVAARQVHAAFLASLSGLYATVQDTGELTK
jgi:nicotinamidase-related amidase